MDDNHYPRRLKDIVKLLEELRIRFRIEYFGLLLEKQHQNSQSPDLKLRELVFIGGGVKKHFKYHLANLIELIPERKGEIRIVMLKTQLVKKEYIFLPTAEQGVLNYIGINPVGDSAPEVKPNYSDDEEISDVIQGSQS
ncbi:hypothetical protein NPIL_574651 [Nephila pilipes]|uniref:Uncharacterized protein n=1 Tax=Nephila pilipes TaxID=299642 RepID=A0A8X6PN22_NEPPI|nr:hypothetical protein NPIL_574651 [Nephila pilipes]